MFYLFLATVCIATIALIFKYTENSNSNRYLITSSNYFIAFSTSLFMVFYKKLLPGVVKTESFFSEFKFLLLYGKSFRQEFSSKIYQNYGLKLSLDTVKTSVAFLVFSAGSIVLINL